MNVTVTKKTKSALNAGTWYFGKINDKFVFETLVFPQTGEFSLNGSKISVLWIKEINGKVVFNYDRGLDLDAASEEVRNAVEIICKKF
jgi:hypothetical protein